VLLLDNEGVAGASSEGSPSKRRRVTETGQGTSKDAGASSRTGIEGGLFII